MKARFSAVVFIAGIYPLAALAEEAVVLKPDAIVCETESPLMVLEQPNLNRQPGSLVMKRVAATIELAKLDSQVQGALRQDRAQEEAIRGAANLPGVDTARESNAAKTEHDNSSRRVEMEEFQRRCVATDASPQNVTILELRPISGVAKISMTIRNQAASVWTTKDYLTL